MVSTFENRIAFILHFASVFYFMTTTNQYSHVPHFYRLHQHKFNHKANTMTATTLVGEVALITGASKGIGKATAIRLAQQGARVVAKYGSDVAAAIELVKGIEGALAIPSNAGSVTEIDALVKEVIKRCGKIDILVLNAGVLPMKDLENTTEEDFDKAFALNVKGPYFLAQKAVPHMAPGSHIIFLSTTLCTASTVQPNYLLYNSTKGAIEQMTRVMAKDLGRKQIYVNAVAPGPTGTELFFKGKNEQVLKMLAGASPMNRIGEPEDIAEAIAYLSGSRWVSGQVVRVNGGMA
jgi:3-oxoacyl-[acyl-carrier protein] reductase